MGDGTAPRHPASPGLTQGNAGVFSPMAAHCPLMHPPPWGQLCSATCLYPPALTPAVPILMPTSAPCPSCTRALPPAAPHTCWPASGGCINGKVCSPTAWGLRAKCNNTWGLGGDQELGRA